jgi:hypothetical protein
MSVEHFALHIGALCVLAVIVGVAVVVAKPELVAGEATTSPRQPKRLK